MILLMGNDDLPHGYGRHALGVLMVFLTGTEDS